MVDRSGQEVTDVVGLFYARASLTEPPLRLAKDAPSVPVSWSSKVPISNFWFKVAHSV